jgi:membrane associated rhomboid family serine protease
MSQFSLWLYPLVLSAGLAIFFLLRAGIKWTWGGLIQQLMILSAAIAGFITGEYALFALIGWSLFFVFNLGSRAMASRALADLTLLRTKSAVMKARTARLLIWGPVGLFGLEMAQAVDAIVSDDPATANRIIEKWEATSMPRRAQESLHGYVMLGRVIERDYQSIVLEYEQIERDRAAVEQSKKKLDRIPFDVFTAAARAYLELDMYDKAVQALEDHDIASYRPHPITLESLFMAYSALLGAETQLQQCIQRLSTGRQAMPPYSLLFWQGRCHARRGDVQEAIATFRRALPTVPENNEAWKSRIEGYIETLEKHLQTTEQEREQQREQQASYESLQAGVHPAFGTPGSEPEPKSQASAEEGSYAVPPLPQAYFQSKAPRTVPDGLDGVSHAVIEDATRNIYAPRLQYLHDRSRYVNDLINPAKAGPGTKALLAMLVAVFLIGNAWQIMQLSTTFQIAEFSTRGVLSAPQVMAGEWYRIFTYMFLHANISHLAMNVLGLMWFGKLVERIYGTPQFLLIYFGSGILSALAHMASTPDQPAVGASGAIMGIFGAGTAAMLRLRGIIPDNIRRTELIWLFSLAGVQVVFDQVINLFARSHDESGSKSLPRVASMAHLGGMISGFALGFITPMQGVSRQFSSPKSDVNHADKLP